VTFAESVKEEAALFKPEETKLDEDDDEDKSERLALQEELRFAEANVVALEGTADEDLLDVLAKRKAKRDEIRNKVHAKRQFEYQLRAAEEQRAKATKRHAQFQEKLSDLRTIVSAKETLLASAAEDLKKAVTLVHDLRAKCVEEELEEYISPTADLTPLQWASAWLPH